MNDHRRFPDEPAGPFPEPPLSFNDREEREIEIRAFEDDVEPLVAMYSDFDPADRAQGIPPATESRVRNWVETLTDGDGYNVVAWHGDEIAGHATLVPDGDSAYELAIFVHQDYQRAGIGSHLIRTLLGYGRQQDVDKVWLTVERWNRAAVNLYRNVGFDTADAESFELEMVLRL
ncbi:GNAT family N-acetyltransferase [Haladaptatus cibarius]|uniref:GNAT family N-acetyltransferase n=1 Tax=Haladaptatus cibarius TaxID=453847 RepID=UPI00067974FF|nr:GNAT family N-acetyltransferase [Haladaptatus cibarius]